MVVYRLKHTVRRMYCNYQSTPQWPWQSSVIPLSKSYSPAKLIATSSSSSCSSSTIISTLPYQPVKLHNILLVAHESRIFLAFFEKNSSPVPLGFVDMGALDRLTLRGVMFLGVTLELLLQP